MCGIAGVADTTGKPIELNLLNAMADKLSHRGPDDEGYYRNLKAKRIDKGQFTCNTLLLCILFVGLVFKGVYLYSYALKSPYLDSPSMDSAVYVSWANLINEEI